MSLIFLQLAAGQAPATLPDLEFNARVTAREVTIRQEGPARLELRAEPGIAPPIRVERSAPPGAKSYRNLSIDLHAEARLADPKSTQQGNPNDRTPP